MIDIREELLGEQQPERLHEQICRCPHIEISIQSVKTYALYDLGSEVIAISEEFYEDNKKVFQDCPKIPINGKIVKGAIGEKTTAIKLQIVCDVSLGKRTEQLIMLIIPKLGKNCIIGYDTIQDLNLMADPEKKEVFFKNSGEIIKYVQMENEEERHMCEISLEDDFRNENELLKMDMTDDEIQEELSDYEIFDKVKNSPNLTPENMAKLGRLLESHRKVFEKKIWTYKELRVCIKNKKRRSFLRKTIPNSTKVPRKSGGRNCVYAEKWHN